MSKRNELVAELNEMGINAQAFDKVDNGVRFEGITIPDVFYINPVVYPDNNTTAMGVIKMIKKARWDNFDSKILTAEFAHEHVKIGMMRSSSTEEIIRRPSEFDGIDQYLYVDCDEFSYKLPANYPEDMWDIAERNTKACTVIKSMSEIICGFRTEDDFMYVVTNENQYRGAGNIIDRDAIRAKGIGDRFFAIPSSIHEWIIVQYSDDMDPEVITQMVRKINGDIVNPEEQLGDRVYILEV